MSVKQYIGARYVPVYIGTHDTTKTYEALSIVSNAAKTKTYTSKQAVPAGTALDNETYWAQSGFFQDGIVNLYANVTEVASNAAASVDVARGDDDVTISFKEPNAHDGGNSYNTAYVLNTLYDTGIYVINCSKCAEVPKALADYTEPVTLNVLKFTYKSGDKVYYIQQIISNNGIYTRNDIAGNWSEWAPAASVTIGDGLKTEGGKIAVNIGDGLKLNDGVITANIGDGLKLNDGVISIDNTAAQTPWEAEATQSQAFWFTDGVYTKDSNNMVDAFIVFNDFSMSPDVHFVECTLSECTLPKVHTVNNQGCSIIGAVRNPDKLIDNTNLCTVIGLADSTGKIAAFNFINPLTEEITETKVILHFTYKSV